MSEYNTNTLHTSDAQSWVFNVDELDAFCLDAPQEAKSAVAKVEDVDYRNLRARLVNNGSFGDTYVVVIEVF